MAKRPTSHVNEEKSRRAFTNSISPEWVIHNQSIDYGIDCKIDVFQNNKSTPYSFYVQLKSKEKHDVDKPLKYRFSSERIIEYINSFLPVMLVVYDVENDLLKYRWVKCDDEISLDELKKIYNQETVTIEFANPLEKHNSYALFKEVVANSIKKRLIDDRTVSYKIALVSQKDVSDLTRNLKAWIRSLNFEGIITLLNQIDDEVDGVIVVDEKIHIGNQNSVILSWSYGEDEYDNINIYKVLIAIQMIASGRFETSIDMISEIIRNACVEIINLEELFINPALAILFSKKNREYEAFKLAEILIEHNLVNAAILFATALINNSKRDYYRGQEYRRLLVNVISITNDRNLNSVFHYNLANNLRGNGIYREAIKEYIISKRLNVGYLNKHYWWSEIAGCFFTLGKFKWAYDCYVNAMSLGSKVPYLKALISDSLFYQKKIEEALTILQEYLRESEFPIIEYQLKQISWTYIKSAFGDTDDFDLLSGLDWFNYSISQGKKNQWINWLTTSLIYRADIESWSNTFISMMNCPDEVGNDLFFMVIHQAVLIHGEEFVDNIIEIKKSQDSNFNDVSETELREVVSDVFERFDKIYASKETFEYRIMI